jgi:hypothetical protein
VEALAPGDKGLGRGVLSHMGSLSVLSGCDPTLGLGNSVQMLG